MAVCMLTAVTGCENNERKSIDDITEEDLESAIAELDKNYGKKSESQSSEVEIKEIDPFEKLKVTFSGTYPYSHLQCEGGSLAVNYIPNTKSGIKNGDTIVINAELTDNEKFSLTETEKEYTVEGLPSYAMSLDEIPDDMMEKMTVQANDALLANSARWESNVKLKTYDILGYYFLNAKDGISASPYNELYFVYNVTTDVTGLKRYGDGKTQETGVENYYTFYRYFDILFLPDGTCSVDLSKGWLTNNTIESDYGYENFIPIFYRYNGYSDLDSMFTECITKNIEKYNYKSTVK